MRGTRLPDCMNKLAKLLPMHTLTALKMVWLDYSGNLATLERYKHNLSGKESGTVVDICLKWQARDSKLG